MPTGLERWASADELFDLARGLLRRSQAPHVRKPSNIRASVKPRTQPSARTSSTRPMRSPWYLSIGQGGRAVLRSETYHHPERRSSVKGAPEWARRSGSRASGPHHRAGCCPPSSVAVAASEKPQWRMPGSPGRHRGPDDLVTVHVVGEHQSATNVSAGRAPPPAEREIVPEQQPTGRRRLLHQPRYRRS
jgi:hypothetical protein